MCFRTSIISYKFGSYVDASERYTLANHPELIDMEYEHQWVNHSRNFVDPITGAHTQTIEGVWENRIKVHLKRMRGIKKEMVASYLDEFLWRTWYCPKRPQAHLVMCGLVAGIKKKY